MSLAVWGRGEYHKTAKGDKNMTHGIKTVKTKLTDIDVENAIRRMKSLKKGERYVYFKGFTGQINNDTKSNAIRQAAWDLAHHKRYKYITLVQKKVAASVNGRGEQVNYYHYIAEGVEW